MAERDDPGNIEDLFDDLDRFFVPDPGGEARQGSSAGASESVGGRNAGAGPDDPPPGDEVSSVPDADTGEEGGMPDLDPGRLATDWLSAVEDLGLPEEPDEADEAGGSGGQPVETGRPSEEPEADAIRATPGAPGEGRQNPDEPSSTRWTPQSTGPEPAPEMGPDDWSRLRDVLGEEEDDQTAPILSRPAAADPGGTPFDLEGMQDAGAAAGPPRGSDEETSYPAGPNAPGEEPPELTLEDMKKPPPEYVDLTRAEPDEEGPMGDVPPSEWGDPSSSEEPREPSRPFWEDVDIVDIEHAADEVAEEFPPSTDLDAEDDLLADLDRPSRPRTVKVGEPEALTGPSWEEPGSRPLIPEPGPPPGGRNVPLALLTGIAVAAVALITVAVSSAAFAVVAAIVALIAQAELYASMQRRGFQPATALGLVLGGLTLAAAYLRGEPGMLFFLALGVVASLLWYMAVPSKAREGAAGNVGATVFGIAYVPFLGGFVLIILGLANSGRALMLAVLGLTIFYDIVAFAGGSLYGTSPLAPTISPKKSWQGLIIASFATFIVGVAVVPLAVDLLTIWRAIGLTLVVLVFAPLGDLAESMIKRDLGVKDSGVFLPGHGGALDRIDSILFVAPAAFYLFRLIF